MTIDILITNALLIPDAEVSRRIDQSFVAIENGRIKKMGSMADLGGLQAENVLDAAGKLLMPGLVNTHCHAAMTLFRGLADDLELMTWLNEHIFPAEAARVNPEMVYWCSKLAAAEMLLSGTTLVADAYFYETEAARAFSETGLRSVSAHGVIDFPAPGVPDPKENIQAVARFIISGKIRICLSPRQFLLIHPIPVRQKHLLRRRSWQSPEVASFLSMLPSPGLSRK